MKIDDRFKRPPIVIGGCGRSGTTLLLSILSAHPSIFAIPDETTAFCPTAYSQNLDLNAPLQVDRIRKALRAADVKNGVARWCEKTPRNVIFFRRILESLGGDVRLINMVRDARDVVLSRHPQAPLRAWVELERWLFDVGAGVSFDKHPQVLVVRYEDLVLRYMETVTTICAFLGEEVHDNLLRWHQHATVRTHTAWSGEVSDLHADSVGKWQRPEYREQAAEVMSDLDAVRLLKHYGYLPPGTWGTAAWKPRGLARVLKRRVPQRVKTAVKRFLRTA